MFDFFMDPKYKMYMMKCGMFSGFAVRKATDDNEFLVVSSAEIQIHILREKDPASIPGGATGAGCVCESMSVFMERQRAGLHLKNSAKKAIISASLKVDVRVSAMNTNYNEYKATDTVFSNASYITNFLVSPRKAVGKALPTAYGELMCMAFRAPISGVSVVDSTARLENHAKYEDIATMVKEYSAGEMKVALDWIVEEVMSMDLQTCNASFIPDIGAGISLNDHFVKSVDDEWGYSNCLVNLAIHMYDVDGI